MNRVSGDIVWQIGVFLDCRDVGKIAILSRSFFRCHRKRVRRQKAQKMQLQEFVYPDDLIDALKLLIPKWACPELYEVVHLCVYARNHLVPINR
jgi:hypothetical protein